MAALEFDLLGVPEFDAALQAMAGRVDMASRATVGDAAHMVERQTKLNATGRPGPKVRSGRLRGGIRVVGPRRAAGGWEAMVGPTVVYSRRIELGFDGTDAIGRTYHQPPYPYFQPAWRFVTSVAVHRIWRDAVARAMGV